MFEVFTTILVVDGKPLWLSEHLARLKLHAKLAGLPPTPRLRRTSPLPKGEGKKLLRISLNQEGYEITIRDLKPSPKEASVYISDQIATSQLKTNQRQVYDLAYQQAQQQGAFEGLLCNQDGYLVDGSRTSLLVRKDNTLTVLEGGIEGITRQQVCLQAQKLGFEIKRAYLKPSEIQGQLLIAGTGIGIIPVTNWF